MSRPARDIAEAALGGLVSTAGTFAASVVVARILGVGGSGEVAYFVWLAVFLASVFDLGMSSAAARFIPELHAEQSDTVLARRAAGTMLRWILVAFVISGVLGGLVIAWRSDWRWPHHLGLWPIVMVFVVSQTLANFVLSCLRGQKEFRRAAKLTTHSMLMQFCAVLAGASVGGVAGAVTGYAAAQVVLAIVVFGVANPHDGIPLDLRRRVLRYAAYAWIGNIANAFVWSRVELFFLDRYWGVEAVGYFAAALALTGMATRLPVVLTTAALPMLSEHKGRQDLDAMKAATVTGTRLLALVLMPSCLGLCAVMPLLLPLLFGDAFRPVLIPSIVVLASSTVSIGTSILINYVWAMERSDVFFAQAIAGALLAIAAGLTIIPAFGLMGAAISRATVQIIIAFPLVWFVVRRLRCPLELGPLLRILAASAVCATAASLVAMVGKGALALVVGVLVGIFVYPVALRLFRAVTRSDIALFNRLIDALPLKVQRPMGFLVRFLDGDRHRSVPCAG